MSMASLKNICTILLLSLLMLPVAYGQILERKCEGNYVVARVNESGVVSWRITSFCPFGCAYGYCLTESTVPVLEVKGKYTVVPGEVNLIAFSITNLGSRGNIKLQTLEKTPWIRLPEEITLESNQTKTVYAIVDVPANLTAYNFTIVAVGSTTYYAPSVLITEKKSAITSIFTPIPPALALSVLIVLAVIFFWILTPKPKAIEESF